jgi:hypothetical protein
VVISYRRFGTTYQPHPQSYRIKKKACRPNRELIQVRVWAVKSLSCMLSANMLVASGWMEGRLLQLEGDREREALLLLFCFILLFITIYFTGFNLFVLCSSFLSTSSLTLSLHFTPPYSPMYPALHLVYLQCSSAGLRLPLIMFCI